jgi:hypothetical protein
VCDEDSLLLSSGKATDSVVGESLGVYIVQHLFDEFVLLSSSSGKAVAMSVETKRHEVPCPHRYVGIDDYLLGNIAQRSAPGRKRRSQYSHLAAVRPLQAQNDSEQRRLTDAIGADQPGELPTVDLERDSVKDPPAGE